MSLACLTADLLRANRWSNYLASRPRVLIRVEVVAVFLLGREFEATPEIRRYRSMERELEERRDDPGGGAIETT